MDNPAPLVSLPQVRERVVHRLTEAFAHDLISVEELEHRLEHVYRAQSAAEVEAIVIDLRAAATTGSLPEPNPDGPRRSSDLPATIPTDRFVAILSSTSRRGLWSVPHHLDTLAVLSDSVLDLSRASLPGDIVDIHVRVVLANLKIVVPAGLRVVTRVGAFLANVETDAALDLAPMVPGTPVIRISGYTMLGSLEIVGATSESGPS